MEWERVGWADLDKAAVANLHTACCLVLKLNQIQIVVRIILAIGYTIIIPRNPVDTVKKVPKTLQKYMYTITL